MIKLTQLLFSIKEETQQKLDDMQAIMQEEYIKAENLALTTVPTPYRYKMKDSDYDRMETPLYILPHIITSISLNFEGDTVVETSTGKDYIVKESPKRVYTLIDRALYTEDGEE